MNMRRDWTAHDLIKFESDIAEVFNKGGIRAPVHLSYGTEAQLISLFEGVREEDWIFCSWRSHYQCLLKGVPAKDVFEAILEGRSIALSFLSHGVFSSAIVAGQIPIALGVALGIKRDGGTGHVWCFMGDMTSETGMANSSIKYAKNFDLPITFVIEDNNLSVCTVTREVWGLKDLSHKDDPGRVIAYEYNNIYPHAGAGKRVQF